MNKGYFMWEVEELILPLRAKKRDGYYLFDNLFDSSLAKHISDIEGVPDSDWELYQKLNWDHDVKNRPYGWLSPLGVLWRVPWAGHCSFSRTICSIHGIEAEYFDDELIGRGWMHVSFGVTGDYRKTNQDQIDWIWDYFRKDYDRVMGRIQEVQ